MAISSVVSAQPDHTDQLTSEERFADPHQRTFDPFRSALILRFSLLNILAFTALGVAYREGYVHKVIAADQTYLSVAIFVAFMVGFVISAWRAWQISMEVDVANRMLGVAPAVAKNTELKSAATASNMGSASMGAMRMRIAQRIAAIRHIANTLVLLGLIGTVLGFIIALSGVDPTGASDVSAIAPMVSTLIQGMSTALYTTLIGSILNVWLMANYQLLSSGTVELMSARLELVERDA